MPIKRTDPWDAAFYIEQKFNDKDEEFNRSTYIDSAFYRYKEIDKIVNKKLENKYFKRS